ncbi:hypothetical protein AB2J22_13295 [Aeromonas sp. A5]|uniref:hypothetical protein n=1 Tax=unclassified Aeromonas TaxID=257493 RepID=UPI00376FE1DB
MSTSPLCADCTHHRTAKNGDLLCARRWVIHINNHATGTSRECLTLCNTAENERGRWVPWACGKNGRHFNAKEVANG